MHKRKKIFFLFSVAPAFAYIWENTIHWIVLSFFRTNQLIVGVFILGYALLLHAVCFWEPAVPIADAPGIANEWLQLVFNERLTWHLPATLLLLFTQALLVNGLIFKHRMLSPVNLFPGVFLVLVSSVIPEFLSLSAYHFANIFLLLGTLVKQTRKL